MNIPILMNNYVYLGMLLICIIFLIKMISKLYRILVTKFYKGMAVRHVGAWESKSNVIMKKIHSNFTNKSKWFLIRKYVRPGGDLGETSIDIETLMDIVKKNNKKHNQ